MALSITDRYFKSLSSGGRKGSVSDLQYAALAEEVGYVKDTSFREDINKTTVDPNPATIYVNEAPPGMAFSKVYERGSNDATPPANWPIDNGFSSVSTSGGYEVGNGPGPVPTLVRRSFWTDSDRFGLYVVPAAVGTTFIMYVNGKRQHSGFKTFTTGAAQFIGAFIPGGVKPNFVEIVGDFYIFAGYVDNPYTMWKPKPLKELKMLVVGDSFVEPSVMNTPSGSLPNRNAGMYQGMAPLLGLQDILIDGRGGSGYLRNNGTAGYENYRTRLPALQANYKPDVIVVHGGGANDIFQGFTVAQIVAQATSMFTEARAAQPNAKLVFVEGSTAVAFNYTAQYIAIRDQLKAALADVGIYYVSTSDNGLTWIEGAGNTNAVNADGKNANIYIGNDGVHPTVAGHAYFRNRLAPKLRAILQDNGSLINTLV